MGLLNALFGKNPAPTQASSQKKIVRALQDIVTNLGYRNDDAARLLARAAKEEATNVGLTDVKEKCALIHGLLAPTKNHQPPSAEAVEEAKAVAIQLKQQLEAA